MTQNRIIPDPNDLFWTLFSAILDWSEFYDEAALCQAAGFPSGTRGHHIYVTCWQGTDDPDDVCSVKLSNTGAMSYAAFDDSECEFGSPPGSGDDVYILGCFVKAA
jgi:hypothetical protein